MARWIVVALWMAACSGDPTGGNDDTDGSTETGDSGGPVGDPWRMVGTWLAVEVTVNSQSTGKDGYASLQVSNKGDVVADFGYLTGFGGTRYQFEMTGIVDHQGKDVYDMPLDGVLHQSTIFGKKVEPDQDAAAKNGGCIIDDKDKKGILHCTLDATAEAGTFLFEIRLAPYSY